MAVKQNNMECTIVCWSVAAFVGLVSMVMLYWMAQFTALQAIFCGGALGTVLGAVLSLMLCRGSKAVVDLSAEKPAQRYAREAAEDQAYRAARLGNSGGDTAPAASAAPAPAAPAAAAPAPVTASKELPGEADLAARKGDWKYEGDAAKAEEVPVKEEAPKTETPAPAAAEKPASASADDKPASMMDKPRAEGADDLKLISGVGPKLEQTLNELGIWHFDQVAAWKKKDIAWVDERLRFKGRIERDDWMSQAKVLAKGGDTEFSKKKKK